MKELNAVLAAYLGYVPMAAEIRRALARPGMDDQRGELPRGTYFTWTKNGEDRSVASIYNIARYYDGREDAAGETIDGAHLRDYLEAEFGHKLGGGDHPTESDDQQGVSTRGQAPNGRQFI